jgi:uncharacterized membrane protein YqiK
MDMNKDDFEDFLDPETARELKNQFHELQLRKQQENINADPEKRWFYEFSVALGDQGVKYFREPEMDFMYVQLTRDHEVEQKVQKISIEEIEEYASIGISATAVAAAIRAGLISPVFKFWRDIEEDNDPEN